MEMKEAFYALFTSDPVNWIKWGIVFFALISGYVIDILLYKKVTYRFEREHKCEIARNRNHVIKATLCKKFPTGKVSEYDWHAIYKYSLNGQEKKYKAFFKNPNEPPLILYLYYVNNPKKLFSMNEYYWNGCKGLIEFLVVIFPWLLAGIVLFLLKIPIPG